MEILVQRFNEKYARTQVETTRDFEGKIDWNNRLIGVKGARGVGKTTLILQHIKKNYIADNTVLYVSLDHFYFLDNKMYDLAETFYQKGGKLLALDEIHRYNNWSQELKNIYDDFPELKIIFSGSSLLQIKKAKVDLSRRAVMYNMPGLSFREYLKFETGIDFPTIPLGELLQNHQKRAIDIISQIRPLEYFSAYLKQGYYPFYLENKESFQQKLYEALQLVLDIDIPQYEQIQISNIAAIKKLLQIISVSVPFKPNYSAISQRSGITINTLKKYVNYLSDANILSLLYHISKGLSSLSKPEKIYLQNSNIMYALIGDKADIGNIRETFFFNQLSKVAEVNASQKTDFLVNNQYSFEVGGKSKTSKQISGVADSFIVKDDIETGYERTIPLWMFGFLY